MHLLLIYGTTQNGAMNQSHFQCLIFRGMKQKKKWYNICAVCLIDRMVYKSGMNAIKLASNLYTEKCTFLIEAIKQIQR